MVMKVSTFFVVCVLTLTEHIKNCDGQRTKDKMYEPIDTLTLCFRRMNGTHQTGCSSKRGGSTGVVHFVAHPDDLDVILKNDNGLDYIPVVPDTMLLTSRLVKELQNCERISGLVVYASNHSLSNFSHDSTCPNAGSNLPGTCQTEWNEYGTGLLQADFRFSVFYVNRVEDVEKIKDCHEKFNNHSYETHPERLLCSLELKGFMYAAIDTPTCVRRSHANLNFNPVKVCDPLGDQNVWGSLFPVGNSTMTPDETIKDGIKYIVVACRMDTTSMFQDLTPGAHSPVTSMVTLLSTAQLLRRMLPNYENNGKNILFVLFHGESYDYIGSERLVYDMKQGVFPTEEYKSKNETIPNIKIEDISLFLEISQVSRTEQLHSYALNEDSKVRNFFTILTKHSKKLNLQKLKVGTLPPASLHSFHRGKSNISGIVIADHGDNYANLFYNSVMDDAEKINYTYLNVSDSSEYVAPPDSIQEHIEELTNALAKSLYEELMGREYGGTEKANGFLVNELFYCYLMNANCLVHQAIQKKKFKEIPHSLYVSVTTSPNMLTTLLGLTLAWFTGIEVSNTSCPWDLETTYVYRYFNMSESIDNLNDTRCFRTSMNFTDAISPAFLIDDYDWSSGRYSSWSESVWRDIGMRLFLKPSKAHEIMTITVGSVVFGLSIVIVWLLNKKAKTLFETDSV